MFGLRKKKSKSRSKKASSRAKKSNRKAAKKKTSKGKGSRKAFGGYSISFAGRTETVEQVFGKGDLPPSQMTKKLWKYVKQKRLASKG